MLAASSLLISPWLNFLQTGVRASHISGNRVIEDTSTSAGINHAIWRLKTNDEGFADSLSPDTHNASYTTTINGNEVLIDVEIPQLPDSELPPVQQPGQHLHVGKERSTSWLKPNSAHSFTYTIRVANYGTSSLHVGEIGDIIPQSFQYVTGSSSGITTADPVVTWENNRQRLTWLFGSPEPKLEAGETQTLTFRVTQLPGPPGIYYNEAWAVDFPPSLGKVASGPTAPIAIGVYNIRTRAGQTAIRAQVAVSSTEAVILGWGK